MDKLEVDTSFITQWVRDWNSSISPELLDKAQEAYSAWYREREPQHGVDNNDELMSANNVVVLGPTEDFKGRKVHKIFAENKTRGRLFSYSIDLSRPQFSKLSPLELGSFIGKPDLSEFEDFGHRELFPHRDYLVGLYYDDYPFTSLAEILRNSGLDVPWQGRDSDYSSDDYRRRSDLLRELKSHVVKTEEKRTAQALIKFVRSLDHTAYSIMRRAQLDNGTGAGSHLSVNAYEWLCGCNETHDPNERDKIVPLRAATGNALRNRRDVGRMWGGLLEYIIGRKVTKAIDNNEPRIPILTNCFGHWTHPAYDFSAGNEARKHVPTTPEFVSWLKGRKWEEFHGTSKFSYDRLYGGFTIAAALPKQWRPRSGNEWKVFDRSKRTIEGIADLLERDVSDVALAIAHIFNRKSDYPDRALKRADTVQDAFTANFEDHHNFGNLSDFLSTIPAQVILPAIVQEAEARGYPIPVPDNIQQWTTANPISAQSNYSYITGHLARNMFRGMSLNDLVKFSNRWHQRLNRIQTRSMKLEGTFEWPALFKDTLVTKDGTVDMQCLTSTGELVYAGNELDNCVGGYTFKCIYGSSHIIQLENRDTLEQALLEIHDVETGKDSGRFVVKKLQIEAPSNKAASPWAVAAATELIERVNSPSKEKSSQISDLSTLNRERAELRDEIGMDVLVLKAGFDPSDAEYADNAYHVLHHEMRDMFPEETREEYLAARGIASQIPVWLQKQQEWNSPKI